MERSFVKGKRKKKNIKRKEREYNGRAEKERKKEKGQKNVDNAFGSSGRIVPGRKNSRGRMSGGSGAGRASGCDGCGSQRSGGSFLGKGKWCGWI